MFLSTVILFLQEVLEAALLISVLLVLSRVFSNAWGTSLLTGNNWVVYGLICGSALGWAYAQATPTISQWFDYVGQDIANASIHFLGFIVLITLTWFLPRQPAQMSAKRYRSLSLLAMTALVVLSVMREGSEMILYLEGGLTSSENASAIISGGVIGTGIGISCGVFLFYSLVSLGPRWSLRFSVLLLALINGSMASQIVMLLSQADWAPFTPIAWNSSNLVPETSLGGRLLYALIGYESTPSVLQVIAYGTGLLGVLSGPLCRHAWLQNKSTQTPLAV
jgi:high-affinity iron transporter